VDKECLVDLNNSTAIAEKLTQQKKYLHSPLIEVISNRKRIDTTAYEENSIISESVAMSKQFDINSPSWIQCFITQAKLKDETKFLNMGIEVERTAQSLEIERLYSSAMTKYPSFYKFIGLSINVSDI
jgi:hypothetical protein